MIKQLTGRLNCYLVASLVLILGPTLVSGQTGSQGYWTPREPPKARYVIDARFDAAGGDLEGKETIHFRNTAGGPIDTLAIDWSIGPASSLSVSVSGRPLAPLNPEKAATLPSPLYYRLPEALRAGKNIKLEIAFKRQGVFPLGNAMFGSSRVFPSLDWDGLPVHDAYSVKLEAPQGIAMAATGRLDAKTGRYEAPAARSFGVFLAKGVKLESREVEGVLVTTAATEKGSRAASICLDTACDVIRFAKSWLGFYPFSYLTIIPGGSGRWGGYPVATGMVAIHGLETYKDGESPLWWKWITAHEIGHEYWGEWVLDPDDPAWLWIAMGIALDTEYLTARGIDPDRRTKWMANYLDGIRSYYDMTVDIPPAQVDGFHYDHNNTVVHSKCPSLIFALDSLVGRPAFDEIYKRCLTEYGGKRLGWKDFRRVCERETGRDLAWFFDQWVRSNAYLCYKIAAKDSRPEGSGFRSTVTVRRLGTMKMPIPVKAVFEDGSEETKVTERGLDTDVLTFESRARLKESVLDPEERLAMLDEPLPAISDEAARALSRGWREEDCAAVYQAIKGENIPNPGIWYGLGTQFYGREQDDASADCFRRVAAVEKDGLKKFAALGWLGLLSDLRGKRAEAVARYREALEFDTGESMRHDQYHLTMNRRWLEERLEKPFTRTAAIEIPADPTARELIDIVGELDWTRQGGTPRLIYEKTRGLKISDPGFWLKLGLLLYDSADYPRSLSSFETLLALDSSGLHKFTALVWMGHLADLEGQRDKALGYYRAALNRDPGVPMTHSQYGMTIDCRWVEERLATRFVRQR
jgi:tetratricopeptide (TPR) repeat protein